MKTVKFMVSAFVSAVLLSATGYSSEAASLRASSKASVDELRSQIVNTFSDVAFEENVDVYVKFTVNEKTGFTVNEVTSVDKAFAETVKSKLSNKKLSVSSSLNGTYRIKISFVKNSDLTYKVSDTELLRSLISEKLASTIITDGGSVEVKFSVKSNVLTVENVEGKNVSLVKSVEAALKRSDVVIPEGLEGKYQVKVSF
jgi:hypothetical protein